MQVHWTKESQKIFNIQVTTDIIFLNQ